MIAVARAKTCELCGRSYVPTGNNQKICTDRECKRRAHNARAAAAREKHRKPMLVECPVCGVEFRRTGRQRYCSVECKHSRKVDADCRVNRERGAVSRLHERRCRRCGAVFVGARSHCGKCKMEVALDSIRKAQRAVARERRLKTMRKADVQLLAAKNDPTRFRQMLLVDTDHGPAPLAEVADGWQTADFQALDPAWRNLCGTYFNSPKRAWLERPRGHSKTSDLAVMAVWSLFASDKPIRGVGCAADEDQARLLHDACRRLLELNPWLAEFLEATASKITNKHTGSSLTIINSDAKTSYGLLPDFLILDELTHWKNRQLWDSLFSAAAKKRNCVLVVIANAGFNPSWQFTLREGVKTDPAWCYSRLDSPCASWITPDRLAEQERLLPNVAYRRLWLNEWTSGAGDALDGALIQRAVTTSLPTGRLPGWVYVLGLDLGLSRDASALVLLGKHVGWTETLDAPKPKPRAKVVEALCELDYLEENQPAHEEVYHEGTGRLRVLKVLIWKPQGKKVEVSEIEEAIRALHQDYQLSCVAADPWQAEFLIQRLNKAGVFTRGVPFVGKNLQSMATTTLDAFRQHSIELPDHPDLLADLRALRVVEKSYGFRLESPRDESGDQAPGTRHGDSAQALSLAILAASGFRVASDQSLQRSLVLHPV